MGGGQYLAEIVKRCEKYHSREQVLPRVYGRESHKMFINRASRYHNLKGANLTLNLDSFSHMKFDVVIGNPPYQKGKNSDFYVKFIEKSADLLKEGGYFSYIVPNRFILPHTKAAKVLVSNFQLLSFEASLFSWFPKVGTSVGKVSGVRSSIGHTNTVPVRLVDGTIFETDPRKMCVPSKKPDAEGVEDWREVSSLPCYVVTKERPERGGFVFIRRQWRSKGGSVYMDAVVGDHPEGHVDGRYIATESPERVASHLRGGVGAKLHELFGDQMNIWPPLWGHLPTAEGWKSLHTSG